MRISWLLPILAWLAWATPASAQVVSVEFHEGRVRIVAENVPVGRILAEWSRLGGTTIVNGERIPGAPVTLQLLDVPEQYALDVVLRGAAGYMVAARDATSTGASAFDRILILPTSRAPTAASLPAPQAAPQFLEGDDAPLVDGPGPGQPVGSQPPFSRLPRGGVQPGLNLPAGLPELSQPENEEPAPDIPLEAPTSVNPFGVLPGTARPGMITPTAPPPNPNENAPRDR